MTTSSDNPWLGAERETIQDYPSSHFTYHETPPPTPPDSKPKNVILFGETGTGKSSVINLMAGRDVALVSPDADGCTLEATEYFFTLEDPEISMRIFDTVGLEEPDMGVNTFLGAIEKAQQLMTTLHQDGGIDLLLFCVRAGRITNAMQRNYRLFFEVLCDKRVPLAIVVTYLENQDVMEEWWVNNGERFKQYEIHPVAHACITTVPARVTLYAEKRAQSRDALRELFRNVLNAPRAPYLQIVGSWIMAFIKKFWSFVTGRMFFKQRDVARRLEERCSFSRADAQKLAEMITSPDT